MEVLTRGHDTESANMFSYVDLEARVSKDHPLRRMAGIVNDVLRYLSPEFAAM